MKIRFLTKKAMHNYLLSHKDTFSFINNDQVFYINNKLSLVELVDRETKEVQQHHGEEAEYVINKFFGYMNFFYPDEGFERNSVELLFKELKNEKKFIHQNV
ncbi:hypothetical protein ABZR37_03450 [Achromobacter ruhlandii]|uniref:hypothetical protein n=1 Tax=Achromobacter ruhlandii TaxID=72557 RepID=UPI0035585BA2